MPAPRVSVIVPVYNRPDRLAATLVGARAQSERDIEIIVADDGSTDSTRDVAQAIAREDVRVRVIANAGPRGPGGARNAAAAAARAPWLAFLDSDDGWAPDKLARFLDAARPEVALVGSDYRMLDSAAPDASRTMRDFLFGTMVPWRESVPLARRAIDIERLRAEPAAALTDPQMVVAMTIGGWLWPHTSSVMVSRRLFEREGGFDASLARTEDMDLWLRLLRRGPFAYVDAVLGTYDITGRDGASGERYRGYDARRRHDAYTEARWHLRFIQSLPARADLTPDQVAYRTERLADHRRLCGHAAGASRPLACAGHYLAALTRSSKHRALLRANPRRYFTTS